MASDDDEARRRIDAFARAQLRLDIEYLLDDPSWLLNPEEDSPAQYWAKKRQLAADLGIDLDKLVAETGTEFERDRWRRILSGELK